MKKNNLFKGLITLSFVLFAFTFGNCGNVANTTSSNLLTDNPVSLNSSNTTSSLVSENTATDSSSFIELKLSSFSGEHLNLLQGHFVISSVEVKKDNSAWETITNYGTEGKIFEPVVGDESTYSIDNLPIATGTYKKVRINLAENQSQVLVQDENSANWHNLNSGSEESGIRLRGKFSVDSSTQITMSISLEVEKKSHENKHAHLSQDYKVKAEGHVTDIASTPIVVAQPTGSKTAPPSNMETAITPATGGTTGGTTAGTTTTIATVWSVQTSPSSANLSGVYDNGSMKISVGDLDTANSSVDGISWKREGMPALKVNYNGIVTDGTVYVAVGNFATIVYGVNIAPVGSPVNLSWNLGALPRLAQPGNLHSVAYGNLTFVSVGDAGTILYSADGYRWASAPVNNTVNLRSVTWNGMKFIAVGDAGMVTTSVDGINWVVSAPVTANNLFSVAGNGINIIATGVSGTMIMSNDNGVTFSIVTVPSISNLNAIAWDTRKFVVVGDAGTVMTSSNGLVWTQETPVTTNNLRGVSGAINPVDGLVHDIIVGDLGTTILSL